MSILTHPGITAFLQTQATPPLPDAPLAVFDCDGTIIRGDIGEAMFHHQIEHFLFKRSPAAVWPDHPRRDDLDSMYHRLRLLTPSARRSSADAVAFADILLSWYADQIAAGAVAKACADIVRLLAGYSLAEVRAIAEETFLAEAFSPLGERTLGTTTLPKGIRYLRESVDLLLELQRRGFDIWALSGSNKWSVEPVFRRLGVPDDHVVGLELKAHDNILSTDAIEPIPVRDGKIPALRRFTAKVPVLVASDSRNDIPLFLSSANVKVRINSRHRDTDDFFRAAGTGPDDSWVLLEDPQSIETGEWPTFLPQ